MDPPPLGSRGVANRSQACKFCRYLTYSIYLKAEGRGLLNESDVDDIKDQSGSIFSDEDGDSDMKAVTVRFARGGDNAKERFAKLQEKSYEYQQKKLNEEPWIETNFHQLKSAKWEEESQKLFCRKMDDYALNSTCSTSSYLDLLK